MKYFDSRRKAYEAQHAKSSFNTEWNCIILDTPIYDFISDSLKTLSTIIVFLKFSP